MKYFKIIRKHGYEFLICFNLFVVNTKRIRLNMNFDICSYLQYINVQYSYILQIFFIYMYIYISYEYSSSLLAFHIDFAQHTYTHTHTYYIQTFSRSIEFMNVLFFYISTKFQYTKKICYQKRFLGICNGNYMLIYIKT